MNSIQALSQEVITILSKKNKTLFIAESCTGGLVTHSLTNISGASKVVLGSICCYSNQIKQDLLKVSEHTLVTYGAVSFECAIEMVKGALEISNSDYALSITGIAGPTGGILEKPVGTVFTAVMSKTSGWTQKFLFEGSREEIKEKSVEIILRLLLATEQEKEFFDFNLCDAREI